MVSAVHQQIRSIVGRRTVTSAVIGRVTALVASADHSLEALTAFTDVLVHAYERGQMPSDARVEFRAAVERLHRAAYQTALTPTVARMSKQSLEAATKRAADLVGRHEAAIAKLDSKLEATVVRIDRRESKSAALLGEKRNLLRRAEEMKGRTQVGTTAKGLLSVVPGLKLSAAAAYVSALGPFALVALGFGGYQIWKGMEEVSRLESEIADLETKIGQTEQELSGLHGARKRFDKNLGVLRAALTTIRELEADYRSRPVAATSDLISMAGHMRRSELVAYNLKQQIGVLTSMNEQADEFEGHLSQLVGALESEVLVAADESRNAEADFLTGVLGGVMGAAGIKGVSATAIREAVLFVKVGPEVTTLNKILLVLDQLGVDRAHHDEIQRDAQSVLAGIDDLIRYRAEVLDPQFDVDLEALSEPQRFLVDVALSRRNSKIDPAKMIEMIRTADIDDRTARRIARRVTGRRDASEALALLKPDRSG